MPLTPRDKRHLRALAHSLDPVVRVGAAGVTEGVVHQVDEALKRELIKVKVDAHRDQVAEAATALAKATGADVAQIIGKVIVMYRPAREREKRKISLPGA